MSNIYKVEFEQDGVTTIVYPHGSCALEAIDDIIPDFLIQAIPAKEIKIRATMEMKIDHGMAHL